MSMMRVFVFVKIRLNVLERFYRKLYGKGEKFCM